MPIRPLHALPPLAAATVYVEPFVACLPGDHPHARTESFRLAALQGDGFIVFSRSAAPAYFDRIISLCVEAGYTPLVQLLVDYARRYMTAPADPRPPGPRGDGA